MAQPLFGDNPVIKPTGKPAFGDNPVVTTQPAVKPENEVGRSGVPGGNTENIDPVDTPEEARQMFQRQAGDDFSELLVSPFSGTVNAAATIPYAMGKGAQFIANALEDNYRYWIAGEPMAGRTAAEQEKRLADQEEYLKPAADLSRVVRENTFQPKTDLGQALYTGGQFMVGGLPTRATLAAPGLFAKATSYGQDLINNVALPALLSEGAGALTEGTKYETLARLVGGFGGNVVGALTKGIDPIGNLVRYATRNMTEEQWAEAERLARQGGRTPIRLTGPEIISEATGGGSPLIDVQRYVEGDLVHGGSIMRPFMADRPNQFEEANNLVLDSLGIPRSDRPTALGARVQTSAQEVIDRARQALNAQTQPLYEAAGNELLAPQDYATLMNDPSYAAALQRLRDHPELGPRYHNYADNSVAVVDAVTKDLFARGEANANIANPEYGPYLGSVRTGTADTARTTARDTSVLYDEALRQQEAGREGPLTDLTAGPVGKVANSGGDTRTVANEIWPTNPLPGVAPEIAHAVNQLTAAAPVHTPQLARNAWEDRFSTAMEPTQNMDRSFGGAKFSNAMTGTPDKQAVLEAVINNIGSGGALPVIDDVLTAMRMTGRRKQQGSNTEFNRTLTNALEANPKVTLAHMIATGGANLFSRASDFANRVARHGQISDIADLFTDPQSVERMRAMALARMNTVIPETITRAGMQGLTTLFGDPDQGRR